MLYLASRSPRRNELLTRLGVPFRILDLEVPEVRAADESAHAYVRRVALDKARAGMAQLAGTADAADAVVLGADTEVVLDDRVFGKPADADVAAAMLSALSARTHQAITALALVAAAREEVLLVPTQVSFAALSAQDIADYVASGEPMGRAGAYAIQGGAERFVSRLDGSYSGVMGLPLHQTFHLLRAFGVL
ncbi:septum formation inhibitor Maf [Xanthomonas hyacinthi]|uniref:dTTP/UTP pyrophosphatase n=1 Tax=Xanthomonas hyacinthi TaxID=56455 RepID=A0A2S7ETF1_9XANT|nr:Maf family nucleotide pyrophosphatase [Xanthomonas hyacinthi]KLD76228.1 septum formation inhibitor Maf [Xanthomonas hyacinthi DSM 19077]PPU96428.1 septum formation inhibitor Maf [Xanthomonas hyacinthi]QGY78914.1 septum formation inhibitor Maf [Xanthomonas hyacinthi]